MQSSNVHEVSRGALANVFLGILGKRFRGIRLTDTAIVLLARKPKEIPFSEMAGPLQVERAFLFRAVSVSLVDGSKFKVIGVKRTEALSFVNATNEFWRRSIGGLFDAAEEELNALADVVERLNRPRRYPSACLLEPFLERADALVARLPNTLSALAGMFRWREIEPYALLAARELVASRVRETLTSAEHELALLVGRVPQVKEKRNNITAIIEYLDGEGDPNILHQIEKKDEEGDEE